MVLHAAAIEIGSLCECCHDVVSLTSLCSQRVVDRIESD